MTGRQVVRKLKTPWRDANVKASVFKPALDFDARDHMAGINTTMNPGALQLGSPGYTFGLGFLLRPADG